MKQTFSEVRTTFSTLPVQKKSPRPNHSPVRSPAHLTHSGLQKTSSLQLKQKPRATSQAAGNILIRWASAVSWQVTPALVAKDTKGGRGMSGLWIAIFLFAQLATGVAQSVTLAWDASPDPSVTGYYLSYGGVTGVYTNTISAGASTSATVTGLVDGSTYYFAATSCDSMGIESAYSTEVVYTVPTSVTNAVLEIQIVNTNGIPDSVIITASGTIPTLWSLQSSADLASWTTIKQGTNEAVNVEVPIGGSPAAFFRLGSGSL